MTRKEKIILLRHLLSDFVKYDWSDGKTLDHYHKALLKYVKVNTQTEKEKNTCQMI